MSRILIVEDETHLAEGLRFNLEAEGHSVHISGKGEEALDLLLKKDSDFEALVLDVMLPGKDGFTVARELREAKNYIPLLMLTARGRPEDVLKGFESGADDYLPKPFNLAILLARLESLLRRKICIGTRPFGAKRWRRFTHGVRAPGLGKIHVRWQILRLSNSPAQSREAILPAHLDGSRTSPLSHPQHRQTRLAQIDSA